MVRQTYSYKTVDVKAETSGCRPVFAMWRYKAAGISGIKEKPVRKKDVTGCPIEVLNILRKSVISQRWLSLKQATYIYWCGREKNNKTADTV